MTTGNGGCGVSDTDVSEDPGILNVPIAADELLLKEAIRRLVENYFGGRSQGFDHKLATRLDRILEEAGLPRAPQEAPDPWIGDILQPYIVDVFGPKVARAYTDFLSESTSIRFRERHQHAGGILDADLGITADLALVAWSREQAEFSIACEPLVFTNEGHVDANPRVTWFGRAVIAEPRYWLCFWYDIPCVIATQPSIGVRGPFQSVSVFWIAEPEQAGPLLESITQQLTQYVVRARRGKVLDMNLNPIALDEPPSTSLAYDPPLAKRIDRLDTAFATWQTMRTENPRFGVFMHGPPGTGKTTTAARIAASRATDVTVFYLPASDILESSAGDNPQVRLREVLEWLPHFAPAIVIMEDVDLFMHARGFGTDQLTSLCLEMLGGGHHPFALFTILSTNCPKKVEEAIADRPGRIGMKIRFDGCRESVSNILRKQAKKVDLAIPEEVLEAVVARDEYKTALANAKLVTPDIVAHAVRYLTFACSGEVDSETVLEALLDALTSYGTKE